MGLETRRQKTDVTRAERIILKMLGRLATNPSDSQAILKKIELIQQKYPELTSVTYTI